MGAVVLETPGEVARAADMVITILPADAELKETVLGETGVLNGFSSDKVLLEMTSGTALAMQEVEEAIQMKGGSVLDAPVSGGTSAAASAATALARSAAALSWAAAGTTVARRTVRSPR